MSFQPTRASPQIPFRRLSRPPPTRNSPLHVNPSDTSIASSTTSVLSLATLSPQDVKVLDAIIERVPPSATSFLDVFKAYNEVLQERGLDASQDVTFYRFLLKLGVLRGTWNERWATVKSGGGANTSNTSGNLTITGLSGQSRLPPVEDVTDDSITTTDLDEECDHGRSTPRQQAQDISSSRPIMPSSTSFARLDDKPATSTPGLRPRPTKPGHTPQQDDAISARPRSNYRTPTTRYEHDYDLDNRASSSSPSGPPSYKSYPIEPLPVRRSATLAHIPTAQTPSSSRDVPRDSSGSKTPRQPLSQTPPERRDVQIPPPRSLAEFAEAATRAGRLKLTPNSKKSASPGSGINAEETWKVLRMEREADDFRLYTLMRRCWDIWLGALEWNRDRATQVDMARSDIIVRFAFGTWRTRSQHYRDIMKQAVDVDSALIRRAVWRQWKHQYAETKRKKVQREMKKQVTTMWQKVQHRVLRGAFYQWHHLHQVKTAERHHGEMVLLRAVQRWRARLAQVDQMDAIADQVLDARNRMTLEHCMGVWRRQERLHRSENVVLRVRDDRILAEAWQTWRNNAQRNRDVNALRRRGILRTSLRKWSKALKRSRALERRADHYIHRQQQVLVRAVLRVWRAKELGERFLRFRQMRLLGAAVSVWKDKLTAVRQLDTRLQTYETRSRGDLLARSVQVWRYRCGVLTRAAAVAEEQHALQLKTRMLLDWRVQLAANLRRSKHARIARKWFTMRRAWKQWQFAVEKKRREKKLAEYETRIVARAFNVWRIAAEKQRKNKFLVLAFKEKVNNRLLSTCINQWILNTVERKDYYIQAEEHRSAIVVRKAFEKWRDLYARYKEGMSLMQSYHDVKREDLLRRAFLRWLAGTRKSIYRKERLEQKQEERKQALVAKAWETWRDRFKERELGWAERQLKLQTDMNILFRAFRIWESKTMSVPALRFLNLNIKAKAWNRWRDALPRAQREHEARELDRSWVLAKAFSKWKDAYKGKVQLKSIARARHLRLPAVPTPRPTYKRPSIGIRTPKSAIARAVERLPSPERPPSLYTQAPERKGTDDSDPSPVQRGSQSPVRGERKSLLSKAYLPTTKPLLNLSRPRHPASAPALSVGARSEREAPSVSGRSAGVPRDGSVVDDSSEAQSDAGSRKSARASPTKEKGKETLAQRFGSLASAPNRTPTAARERLRLGLKSTSKRTGKL